MPLREAKGWYEFIGKSHLDGFMNGGALDKDNNFIGREFDIV